METPSGSLPVHPGRPAPLRSCGIVTAYNPASRRLPPEVNQRADAALLDRIDALTRARRGSAYRSVAHGTGEDAGAWYEPGWCLAGGVREEVVRLGAEFGQNAVVWIDAAGKVTIVCTRDGFCGAKVGEVLRMEHEG